MQRFSEKMRNLKKMEDNYEKNRKSTACSACGSQYDGKPASGQRSDS